MGGLLDLDGLFTDRLISPNSSLILTDNGSLQTLTGNLGDLFIVPGVRLNMGLFETEYGDGTNGSARVVGDGSSYSIQLRVGGVYSTRFQINSTGVGLIGADLFMNGSSIRSIGQLNTVGDIIFSNPATDEFNGSIIDDIMDFRKDYTILGEFDFANFIGIRSITPPANPTSGKRIYLSNVDNKLKTRDTAGTDRDLELDLADIDRLTSTNSTLILTDDATDAILTGDLGRIIIRTAEQPDKVVIGDVTVLSRAPLVSEGSILSLATLQTSPSVDTLGFMIKPVVDGTPTNGARTFQGFNAFPVYEGTTALTNEFGLIGGRYYIRARSVAGDIADMTGLSARCQVIGSARTITRATGFRAEDFDIGANQTLVDGKGFWAEGINARLATSVVTTGVNFYGGAHTKNVSATFTNAYGLFLEEQTVGSAINNSIFIAGAGKIAFRDQQIFIRSSADGNLDFSADVAMTFGDGGTTDYFEVQGDGDVFFVGGSGLAYGSAWSNTQNTRTISDSNPTEITSGVSVGEVHNVTFGGAHHLRADTAGRYKISWSMTIASVSAVASLELEGGIMKNTTGQNDGRSHTTRNNTTDQDTISGFAIFNLAVNDEIALFVQNFTDTTNINVENISFHMVQVGG